MKTINRSSLRHRERRARVLGLFEDRLRRATLAVEKMASDFEYLFAPRGVAIVGASGDPTRIGGQPLHALVKFGFGGGVYPVNPKHAKLFGQVCYPSIATVPTPCDVAILAIPAEFVPLAVRECGRAGIQFAIVFSAGFREIGNTGERLQKELDDAIAESDIRVVGPNCLGILGVNARAYCGFGSVFQNPALVPGRVAMVSQSGGFGYAVVGLAECEDLDFNYVASTGNETDVTALDLIEYLIEREDVELVVTYLEGVADGRRLIQIGARALCLEKPILVYKVGNSDAGRRAAVSHTANLTADYQLYRAAFKSGAFIELNDVNDLVDIARAFDGRKRPLGKSVGVLTASGGAGVMLADRCEEHGLHLATFAERTLSQLKNVIPHYGAAANPVDVTGQVLNDPSLLKRAAEIVLSDPAVDQLVVCSAAIQGKLAHGIAQAIVDLDCSTAKPVFVVWSAIPGNATEAMAVLKAAAIPCFSTPPRAAVAVAALNRFAERVRMLNGRRQVEERVTPYRALKLPRNERFLNEHESKACFAAYGIPTVREKLLSFEELARLSTPPFEFPLVAKLCSPDVAHKSDLGLVHLNLRSLQELNDAARSLANAALHLDPKVRVDGILVQEMVSGLELIIGCVNDKFFGPTVLIGLGGLYAEILHDTTHRFAPISVDEALQMISELKGGAIFDGLRGQDPLDKNALAGVLSRVSLLVSDHSERILEIDINPLFLNRRGVIAADGLIVLRTE